VCGFELGQQLITVDELPFGSPQTAGRWKPPGVSRPAGRDVAAAGVRAPSSLDRLPDGR
jgi:hypothetical protein